MERDQELPLNSDAETQGKNESNLSSDKNLENHLRDGQPEKVINDVRSWLEKNKIFFETIVAIIISVISIFVAIKTNRIEQDQKEIAQIAASPFIDVASEYDEDGNVTRVEIVNTGGLLKDIRIEIFPYIYYSMLYGQGGTLALGVYPIELEYDDSGVDYTELGMRDYKIGQYKILATHTKVGSLYEVRNTDLMGYISKMMANVKEERVFYVERKEGEENIVDSNNQSTTSYIIASLSFEYMIKIDYSSYVDKNPKTEIFRVTTGEGLYSKLFPTPGVSIVKNNTLESEIYNIVSNNSNKDYFDVKGSDDCIQEDNKQLFSYLPQKLISRKYRLGIKD